VAAKVGDRHLLTELIGFSVTRAMTFVDSCFAFGDALSSGA
jgi:hypothetical protein